jgi:hypothetical protein
VVAVLVVAGCAEGATAERDESGFAPPSVDAAGGGGSGGGGDGAAGSCCAEPSLDPVSDTTVGADLGTGGDGVVAPSSDEVVSPAPEADAGVDASGEGEAPACAEATAPCEETAECCGDLLCGTTSLGTVCCGDVGATCTTVNGEDCCGALLCLDGTCQVPPQKTVEVQFQVQETGYWCGPAATRVALSARIAPPSQATLASELPTTTNGTDWIGQVTAVLNDYLGPGTYRTTEMPNDPPTLAQHDQLWSDLVYTIDMGYVLVANIVAPPSNHPPGYPDDRTIYHYFSVIGYDSQTREVYIADPASFQGNTLYWISFDQLSTLIPPKGYSSLN